MQGVNLDYFTTAVQSVYGSAEPPYVTWSPSAQLTSGAVYTGILVWHWRTYRRKRHWLSGPAAERGSDSRTRAPLHAHSVDAAQQGFYKACKTAKACKQVGLEAKYPYHRKRWRTTIWKNSGISRTRGRRRT